MICLHHNDHDGRSSAAEVAAHENDYDPKHYIELDYVKKIPFDIIAKNEKVYIVDYSFSIKEKDNLDKLLSITKNIIWIDHHDSTLELIKKFPEYDKIKGLRKKNISGAALTHMYLNNKDKLEDCPKYIQLISDFDCWIYKFKDITNYFKFGIETYDYSALSDLWMFMDDKKVDEILEKGKYIYEYVVSSNLEYLNKYGFECVFEDLKCLAVNKRDNSIIFGDKIDDYDIVSTFVFNGDTVSYSIFTSKDNINCAKIAEKYGGGGHKKAAGFVSNKLILRR